MDVTKFQLAEANDMNDVRSIFKKIFVGKTIGTDDVKMGTFRDCVCAAKVEGNRITFALPFNGPIGMLRDLLSTSHYNKTNSIFCTIDVNEDNTILTATYYTKEYKMFDF